MADEVKRFIVNVSHDQKVWHQYAILSEPGYESGLWIPPEELFEWKWWEICLVDDTQTGWEMPDDHNLMVGMETGQFEPEAKDVEGLLVKIVEHFPGLSFRERILFMHLLSRAFGATPAKVKKRRADE